MYACAARVCDMSLEPEGGIGTSGTGKDYHEPLYEKKRSRFDNMTEATGNHWTNIFWKNNNKRILRIAF